MFFLVKINDKCSLLKEKKDNFYFRVGKWEGMDNQYRLLIIGASLDEELALKNALANDYLLVFLPSIKETTIFLQNPNNDDVSLFIVAERLVVNSSNVY